MFPPSGQKSIADQIELVFAKWNPESRNSYFQTYLYNNAGDNAPFLRPDPTDDEEKWEEALQKRPYPEAIPTPVKGFGALGQRIIIATDHLNFVHGRIAEINKGLTHLLQKHDLEVSVRVEECQRRHLRISQKCLALATKTQVLRNRGYAMDGAEEQLRQKLLTLEKNVMDPALVGRSEEIWARMVSVRERGRQLQFEFEKAGKTLQENHTQAIDPETLKTVKKVRLQQSRRDDLYLLMIHLDSRRLRFAAGAFGQGAGADQNGVRGMGADQFGG
jgi:nuclear pore complex protein Nup54